MSKFLKTRTVLAATAKTSLVPAVSLANKVHDPVMSGAKRVKERYNAEAEATRAKLEAKAAKAAAKAAEKARGDQMQEIANKILEKKGITTSQIEKLAQRAAADLFANTNETEAQS